MKNRTLLGLTLFLCSTTAFAKQYQFVCRGDNRGGIVLNPQVGGSTVQVTVGFIKSTQAATSGLSPGQCGWLDRAVRSTEPHFLTVTVPSSGGDTLSRWMTPSADGSVFYQVGFQFADSAFAFMPAFATSSDEFPTFANSIFDPNTYVTFLTNSGTQPGSISVEYVCKSNGSICH